MLEANFNNGICTLLLKKELMDKAQYLDLKKLEKLLGKNFGCPEEQHGFNIIVDMRELDYVQSSAIGVLLILRKKVKSADGECVLINVKQSIQDALELAGLLDFFKIFNSQEQAKKYLL